MADARRSPVEANPYAAPWDGDSVQRELPPLTPKSKRQPLPDRRTAFGWAGTILAALGAIGIAVAPWIYMAYMDRASDLVLDNTMTAIRFCCVTAILVGGAMILYYGFAPERATSSHDPRQ